LLKKYELIALFCDFADFRVYFSPGSLIEGLNQGNVA